MQAIGGRPVLAPYQVHAYRVGLKPAELRKLRGLKLGVLGAATTAAGAQTGFSVGASVGGVAAGATAVATGLAAGSVAGPIGSAVGAVVGAVVGALSGKSNTASHIGTWDTELVQALGSIPYAAGVGRQIPWNEDSHGLVQMIEACLATQVYMAWDASLVSSYDVCAHWAMTFAAAVQAVCTAAAKNPAGKTLTVPITNSPGGQNAVGPFSITFVNPGIAIGPDAFSQKVIMGSGLNHLMYKMIVMTGETAAHASENGSNAAAQKVYALMADYVFAQVAPTVTQPAKAVPKVSTVVPAASSAAKTVVAVAPPATQGPAAVSTIVAAQAPSTQIVTTTASGQPVTSADIANLIAALQAQGLSASQATQDATATLAQSGVDTSAPAVQQAISQATGGGISLTPILLLGGGALLIYFLMRK